jgi:serine/threonine protein kinase
MADGVLENVPVVGIKRTFPRAFGRYVLEKSLSRGGMGEVFLSIARVVNQRCVIKTIRGDLTGDEEFIGRFADEAKIMMRIQHDNVIRVFDAGRVGNDYYIAMEYVHGRDLGDVLDRAYERGEPMPTQLGLYVADKLLDGLDYAHKLKDEHGRPMGIVHRDVSPQNVLIGFDGSVKLIDFGLARTDLLPGRTQGALAVGKYGYMSPEQARHERIDGRADIYSTGVMLFEVFTGDRLVDEQDQATLWSRVLNPKHRKPSTVISSLPQEIDQLIMTAVSVKADDRFADAQAMRKFVQSLRTEKSNRDDFIRYLRYLYPKVDFNPAPMPDVGGTADDGEKSMIIATSREAALSVFGRGELPIEWTTQIDAAELQAVYSKHRERQRPRDYQREAITDASIFERPSDQVEATLIRSRADQPQENTAPRRKSDEKRQPASADSQTQIAELRADDIGSAETRYARAPVRATAADLSQPAGVDSATEHHTPALGATRVAHQFRDDEMTVMMDAPPRNVVVRAAPSVNYNDEDTRDGDAPTRLTNPAPSVEVSSPSQTAIVRGRAIQERNAGRTNLKDRTEREDSDRGRERERERAEREKKSAVAAKKTVAHRATVPPTEHTIPAGKRHETTLPPFGSGGPEPTQPEQQRSIGLLPGIILMGLAVVIILLVMLLFRI